MARHTSDHVSIDLIALAILRRDDRIVLVQQKLADNAPPVWVVPGGMVEAGELITEGLHREVKEEAGVQIKKVSSLACVVQVDRPAQRTQTIAYFFAVDEWTGELGRADGETEVTDVQLVPLAEAVTKIQNNGSWPCIQTPLLRYLQQEQAAGTTYMFREDAKGQHLVEMF